MGRERPDLRTGEPLVRRSLPSQPLITAHPDRGLAGSVDDLRVSRIDRHSNEAFLLEPPALDLPEPRPRTSPHFPEPPTADVDYGFHKPKKLACEDRR